MLKLKGSSYFSIFSLVTFSVIFSATFSTTVGALSLKIVGFFLSCFSDCRSGFFRIKFMDMSIA